ncbi:MAG TPA: hypothetical protein VFX58_05665 [Chitinophagaceae bacterium]|nr:hypothetical protein [Chitinophagaceae bacterium]
MKGFIISLMLVIVVLSSCYYDIEEELYPPVGNCDAANASYSNMVLPLLQTNSCLGCHSGPAPSGNILLDGYTNVRTVALSGKLYGSISHAAGFSPMPQGGNKMNACNLSKIKAWIDAGAPNN